MASKSPNRVAYQGVPGAYSEMAARKACPDCEPLPCDQFEVAFQVSRTRSCAAAALALRGGDPALQTKGRLALLRGCVDAPAPVGTAVRRSQDHACEGRGPPSQL